MTATSAAASPLAALAAAEANMIRQVDAATARLDALGTSTLEAALDRYRAAAQGASDRIARAANCLTGVASEVLWTLDSLAAGIAQALTIDAAEPTPAVEVAPAALPAPAEAPPAAENEEVAYTEAMTPAAPEPTLMDTHAEASSVPQDERSATVSIGHATGPQKRHKGGRGRGAGSTRAAAKGPRS